MGFEHRVDIASRPPRVVRQRRRWHTQDDPLLGTPVDPERYDYRRAAWDAVHFPRLLDRYWHNLRRAVGWNVQYAGCVEPQRRLAPHAHFAIRGTIPRAMLELVATATYHQVWWPDADRPRYPINRPPTWDTKAETWVDPDTGRPLPSWSDALDAIDEDPDAEPAHLVRFGVQIKAKGVDPASQDVERTIGYITKYVTKAAAECHTTASDPQRDHLDQLWRELRVTPCSERCANWLLYGVQPKKAHGRLRPGHCKGRVHQKTTLGIGGRRVLVSRDWSGKTLADHRADAHAWAKALLGVTTDETEPEQQQQVAWEMARYDDPDLPPLEHRLLRAVSERIRRRSELAAARQRAAPGEETYPMRRGIVRQLPIAPRLWSVGDVSEFLGIPVGTLYQWRHRGQGPRARKVGRHLRYDPADVQSWLEEAA